MMIEGCRDHRRRAENDSGREAVIARRQQLRTVHGIPSVQRQKSLETAWRLDANAIYSRSHAGNREKQFMSGIDRPTGESFAQPQGRWWKMKHSALRVLRPGECPWFPT